MTDGQENHPGQLPVLPTQTRCPLFLVTNILVSFKENSFSHGQSTYPGGSDLAHSQTPRGDGDLHLGPAEEALDLLEKGYFLSDEVTTFMSFWSYSKERGHPKIKPTWRRDGEGWSLRDIMRLSDVTIPETSSVRFPVMGCSKSPSS